MAFTFRYAPTKSIAKQGIFGPAHPLTISVQGFLIPTPIGGADITMGGMAVITTNINGTNRFYYYPSAQQTVNVLGNALVVSQLNGVLCVDYKPAPAGAILGGAALTISPNTYKATGGLVTDGCSPNVVILNGVLCATYTPSAIHSINVQGDAQVVATQAGITCVDYKAAPYGVVLGGEAPVTAVLSGVNCHFYPATGGVTMGGEADVVAIIVGKTRGGKGTPYFRRRHVKQATHHYYHAEAFFENSLVLGGEATAIFRPAPYAFIKSLPKTTYTPKRDSEFVDLFKRLEAQPRTKTFSYKATGGVTAAGETANEYFDFTNFIITHDEDIILSDILSSNGSPFITTTFDRDIAKLRRDDDDIIEIFELM